MYTPVLKHNLISVQKLTQEQGCKVMFHPEFCIIQDSKTGDVRGIGKAVKGVYYLVNEKLMKLIDALRGNVRIERTRNVSKSKKAMMAANELQIPTEVEKVSKPRNMTGIWHKRLGHAPIERTGKIEGLKGFDLHKAEECLTCPVAKFTKLAFKASTHRAKEAFELIHIETCGPYRVQTREGYKYFLTIVDDFSRVTWVHLLKAKNDAHDALVKFVHIHS